MHELSIMQALFRQLEELAREHGARRVVRLDVEVGEFSNVVPGLLEQAFDAFRQAEPLLADSEMRIRRIPLRLHCRDCGERFSPHPVAFRCPECGSGRVRALQGEDLLLRDVELEVPETQEAIA